MNKLTLILTLFFSTMFASPAYADWVAVGETTSGNTFYVDFTRIRTNGGYVYYWQLFDLLKPDENGDLSYKVYHQGDCEMFRYKILSGVSYKQPMGEGSGESAPPILEWDYPTPNSVYEYTLKKVCDYAENL